MMMKSILRACLAGAALATAGAAAAQDSPTLSKIAQRGTITLGIRDASVPFNFLDDANSQAGYAWEIALRIADAVKRKLNKPDLAIERVTVSPPTRIQLVANHTVDLECSSTTNNLERQRQVSFSNTFFIVGARLLVKKTSGVKDWKDLNGKPVVVSAGTTAERILRKLNEDENLNITILLAKDIGENFLMVETGRAVAAMQDDVILYSNIARARNPAVWEVVASPRHREAYACMMRKDDPAFKAIADEVIAGLMKSGEMDKLYKKYFLDPIAVKGGVSVSFPMSDDMRELYQNPNDRAL
jgi:glutamate/aspartate transport system substrate-binding protein